MCVWLGQIHAVCHSNTHLPQRATCIAWFLSLISFHVRCRPPPTPIRAHRQAFEELEELLSKNNICIAVKEKLVKDSGVAEATAYDSIVLKLLTKPRARGTYAIYFTNSLCSARRGQRIVFNRTECSRCRLCQNRNRFVISEICHRVCSARFFHSQKSANGLTVYFNATYVCTYAHTIHGDCIKGNDRLWGDWDAGIAAGGSVARNTILQANDLFYWLCSNVFGLSSALLA